MNGLDIARVISGARLLAQQQDAAELDRRQKLAQFASEQAYRQAQAQNLQFDNDLNAFKAGIAQGRFAGMTPPDPAEERRQTAAERAISAVLASRARVPSALLAPLFEAAGRPLTPEQLASLDSDLQSTGAYGADQRLTGTQYSADQRLAGVQDTNATRRYGFDVGAQNNARNNAVKLNLGMLGAANAAGEAPASYINNANAALGGSAYADAMARLGFSVPTATGLVPRVPSLKQQDIEHRTDVIEQLGKARIDSADYRTLMVAAASRYRTDADFRASLLATQSRERQAWITKVSRAAAHQDNLDAYLKKQNPGLLAEITAQQGRLKYLQKTFDEASVDKFGSKFTKMDDLSTLIADTNAEIARLYTEADRLWKASQKNAPAGGGSTSVGGTLGIQPFAPAPAQTIPGNWTPPNIPYGARATPSQLFGPSGGPADAMPIHGVGQPQGSPSALAPLLTDDEKREYNRRAVIQRLPLPFPEVEQGRGGKVGTGKGTGKGTATGGKKKQTFKGLFEGYQRRGR